MSCDDMYRWAKWWANRYRWAIEKRGDISFEDLTQAAVLGILRAMECYDGVGSWAQYSSYFIRKEIRTLCGVRWGKSLPPFVQSLNVKVGDDEDTELIELLPDETAPDPEEVAEYNDLKTGVREAVARLKNDQEREVVERNRLNGEPLRVIAADFGVSFQYVRTIWTKACKHLSQDRKLRKLAEFEGLISYISRSSVKSFNSTNTSDVERIVMLREQMFEKVIKTIPREAQA